MYPKRGKAISIDVVDKEIYEEGLVEKLIELVKRMQFFKYIPKLTSKDFTKTTLTTQTSSATSWGSWKRGGGLERMELRESDKGTPQGGRISPVHANVYLH